MITRWVKAGIRGVQVSRFGGFHGRNGFSTVNSDVSDHFHPNLRRDHSTTTRTARGTAACPSSLVPSTNKGNCGGQSSGCLGPVRHASNGSQRWNSNVERASSRTQLARFLIAEYPPTLSSMRARGPAATAAPAVSIGRALRKLSTNSEKGSKTPEGPDGDKKLEVAPVAEAGIGEITEGLPEEPRHSHVEMPSITDTEREAILTSWNVKVGDAIEAGDVVCEIELEQFSVGVTVETFGFLAEILVEAGTEKVPVGAPIATIVHTEEDIALYRAAQETLAPASEEPENEDSKGEAEDDFTWKDVLKAVLRLRQNDKLSEELASTLMSLARSKDADLLQAFEGCYEGDVYLGEIDDELFLLQAKDIAKTRRKQKADEGVGRRLTVADSSELP